MMVAAAAMLFLFLIIAAVVLNVGWWLRDKRDAQNDVDAAVLAGAQELPDEDTARAVAEAWAVRNNVTSGDLNCCDFEDLNGDGSADLIRATVEREPGLLVGNLLDVGTVTVTARAAAAKQQLVAACVVPWAVIGDPTQGPAQGGQWGLTPEALYIFHTSLFFTPGNFGALGIYGNGEPAYEEAIVTPCGSGTEGACDQADPYVEVGETLECDVGPANMGQNTHDALTQRDQNYGGGIHCDAATYDQAVQLVETSPECAQARVLLIPIIITWPPQGHSGPIDILGIVTFYVAGWDRQPPYKGDLDVTGDTISDDAMVWGYFLEDQPVVPAWKVQWGYSDDPFAPIKILLVE